MLLLTIFAGCGWDPLLVEVPELLIGELPEVLQVEAGSTRFEVPFVIRADDPESAEVTASSSNEAVVPDEGLEIVGTGSARALIGEIAGPGTAEVELLVTADGRTESLSLVIDIAEPDFQLSDAFVAVGTDAIDFLAVEPDGTLIGVGQGYAPSLEPRTILATFGAGLQLVDEASVGEQPQMPRGLEVMEDGTVLLSLQDTSGGGTEVATVAPDGGLVSVSGARVMATDGGRIAVDAMGSSGRLQIIEDEQVLVDADLGSWVTALDLRGGLALAATEYSEDYSELHMVDATTGAVVWSTVVQHLYNAAGAVLIDAQGGATFCGGRLTMVSDDHDTIVRHYDATGAFDWTIEDLDAPTQLDCLGMVQDVAGTVFVNAGGRKVMAVDTAGQVVWEVDTEDDALRITDVAEHGGVVYAGIRTTMADPEEHWLLALDAATGEPTLF